MTNVKPSRPQRKGSTKTVEKPATEAKAPSMKYSPREKVGTPKLGSPITVKTVGLGNLEVITHNGNTNV